MPVVSGQSTTSFPQPTFFGQLPKEGSKFVLVSVPWSTLPVPSQIGSFQYTYLANFLAQFQSGQFNTLQSVYVDNSVVPYEITLTVTQTGQRVRVPPFACGLYPLLVTGVAPAVAITMNQPNNTFFPIRAAHCGATELYFLNTLHPSHETRQLDTGSDFFFSYQTYNLNAGPQIIIPPAGNNQLYAFTSLAFTYLSSGVYAVAQPVQIRLFESGTTGQLWTDQFWAAANSPGLYYRQQFIFPTPCIQLDPSTSINITLSAFPAPVMNQSAMLGLTFTFVPAN